MKTICYDFEDSFGIPHSLMSVKEPLLARATQGTPFHLHRRSSLAEGLRRFEGRVAHVGILRTQGSISALLCIIIPWKLTCFSSAGFPEITLNTYQTLKEQAKAPQRCYYI